MRWNPVKLAKLPERLVKLVVMLATLSLRIMELADARTRCSLLVRPGSPGNGRISRDQTSESKFSSLALSLRDGVSIGIRLVVRRDWDRLIVELDAECGISFIPLVFLIIT
jgi:hypothetical protein